MYFYSEHLESSVTIYSVLQVVLFVELLCQINEISGILQIVRKLASPGELFYTRPINTRLSMSMKPTTLTVKQKADLIDKRSELLKPLKHDKNVYLHNQLIWFTNDNSDEWKPGFIDSSDISPASYWIINEKSDRRLR